MSLPSRALCGRCFGALAVRRSSSVSKLPWRKEAERIVGYPTSFLNLRYLLSDEISNVVGHLRKLVGTKHPLLKTARMLLDDETGFQSRGITVLLMSKALASSAAAEAVETAASPSNTSGISASQRHLSEIIELIYTAELIHANIVNVDSSSDGALPADSVDLTAEQRHELSSGNKLTVLLGDYLLANASSGLGKLHHTVVTENISQALSDMKVAAFLRQSWDAAPQSERFSVSDPLFESDTDHITQPPAGTLSLDGTPAPWKAWLRYIGLAHASLLSHGCAGSALLAGVPDELQHKAGLYGWHLAFADELHNEAQPLQPDSMSQLAPGLLRRLCQDKVEYDDLCQGKLSEAQRYHAAAAVDSLAGFPHSDAAVALRKMAEELT